MSEVPELRTFKSSVPFEWFYCSTLHDAQHWEDWSQLKGAAQNYGNVRKMSTAQSRPTTVTKIINTTRQIELVRKLHLVLLRQQLGGRRFAPKWL